MRCFWKCRKVDTWMSQCMTNKQPGPGLIPLHLVSVVPEFLVKNYCCSAQCGQLSKPVPAAVPWVLFIGLQHVFVVVVAC